jgi:hypothetical protein
MNRVFKFSSKNERNSFLESNWLCLAGGVRVWPNVLNPEGEFVGGARQLLDGSWQIEIWDLHAIRA